MAAPVNPHNFSSLGLAVLKALELNLHNKTHTYKHTLTVNHASKITKIYANIQKIINVYLGTLALNKGILELGIFIR